VEFGFQKERKEKKWEEAMGRKGHRGILD